MIGGLILLGLAAFFWFVIAKDRTAESATTFIRVVKATIGVKGYIILTKILAVFMLLSAVSAFYKYFMGKFFEL